jgi:septal ring factor EnvC (AmiA/AmiB activator)
MTASTAPPERRYRMMAQPGTDIPLQEFSDDGKNWLCTGMERDYDKMRKTIADLRSELAAKDAALARRRDEVKNLHVDIARFRNEPHAKKDAIIAGLREKLAVLRKEMAQRDTLAALTRLEEIK